MTFMKIAMAISIAFVAKVALATEQTCTFNGMKTSTPETVGSENLSVRLRYSAGARSSYMVSKAATQMEITSSLRDLQEIVLYSAISPEPLDSIHCNGVDGTQECFVNGQQKSFKFPGAADVKGVKVEVSVSKSTGKRIVKLNVPKEIAIHATTGWDTDQKIQAHSGRNHIRINCPAYVDDHPAQDVAAPVLK